MTDSSLVRVLDRQSRNSVGLLAIDDVRQGAERVRDRLRDLADQGHRLAIADVIDDSDLMILGEALADAPLITGGSGIALGLAEAWHRRGLTSPNLTVPLPMPSGRSAVLSGSCSEATNQQVVRALASGMSGHRLMPSADVTVAQAVEAALTWFDALPPADMALFHATDTPDNVRAAQAAMGREAAGTYVEQVVAGIATGLAGRDVTRLVVAGGETSGAVIGALDVRALQIGPEIAPGVPWTVSVGPRPMALALKSGNFGGPDFFRDALSMLDGADGIFPTA